MAKSIPYSRPKQLKNDTVWGFTYLCSIKRILISSRDSCNDLVFAALNTYVPKVIIKHANCPPWITKDLAKAINKKKTLWRRIKKQKTPDNMERFGN